MVSLTNLEAILWVSHCLPNHGSPLPSFDPSRCAAVFLYLVSAMLEMNTAPLAGIRGRGHRLPYMHYRGKMDIAASPTLIGR